MGTSWNEPEETTQVFDSERIEGGASGSERWYISPDGKSKEVLEAREIIERARAGALSDSTLVWRDGLTDWTRLDAVPELMQAVRAFRSSVVSDDEAATVMIDPEANRESSSSYVATLQGDKVPAPSLPPLAATPGRPITSLPPLPALPQSPRPPTQTLSGAPLPPPPSLPPLPGARKSTPDVEKPEVSSGAPTAIAAARPTPSGTPSSKGGLSPQVLAARVSTVVDKARPLVAKYSERAKVYLDRDYDLPKVGRVSGRLLAASGGGVIVLLLLLVWLSGGDEPAPGPTAALASAESPAVAAPEVRAHDDETGLDLDEAKPTDPGVVPLSDLKSLRPGEKPPEVTKESTARARAAKTKEFDVYAAKSALTAAAAKAERCKGPKGEGSVRVKIAPSGKVVSATVTTASLAGTAAQACVEQAFKQATVPPFSGDDKTVYKKFVIR